MERYTNEQLEKMMEESYTNKKYKEGIDALEQGDNPEKGIELILEAAINGYIPAMYKMANICHNNIGNLNTQDRTQELFWYRQTYQKLEGKEFLYHAQNMMEHSYDTQHPSNELVPILEIASAMGKNKANEYLASNFSKNMNDKESLKKSLFWFYSIDNMSSKFREKLYEVEKALNIK